MKSCIRCRRAREGGLLCQLCIEKATAKMRREAKKPELEREVYRDHDHAVYLANVREALEAMESVAV